MLEMFAGIGGFRLGMQQAGYKFNYVGFSEIDKYASQVYKKHFPESEELGDATTINPDGLPRIDIIVGGFPCQTFSIAGNRKGFDDTRGTLFFDIARIAKAKRPKVIFLENVRGLLSHDKGRTFETIIRTLGELGYIVQWQVLNSKHFGVPQNRERVFIIGHLGEGSFRKVFPLRENGEKPDRERGEFQREIRAEETANCLTARYYKMGATDTYIEEPKLKELTNNQSQGYRVYDPSGISATLASEAGGLGAKTGLYKVPTGEIEVIGNYGSSNYNQSRKIYDSNGICPTLCAGMGEGGGVTPSIEKDSRIRRLTPLECERLQGFPDGWTEGHSDTQRYKMCGNAVTVNVIKEIADQLYKGL